MDLAKYELLESKFSVCYPDNKNATYTSLLNYSNELDKPFQRWYRYKEGFSEAFVSKITEVYRTGILTTLLDPFAGSGTTLLTANTLGLSGIGFEVNPFSFFLMKVKQDSYSKDDLYSFRKNFESLLLDLKNDILEDYVLPELSFSSKVFQKSAEPYVMSAKVKIQKLPESKVRNLLFLGWLACIEELSDYRKAGNGLKKRKTVKPFIVDKETVIKRLSKQYTIMYEDLESDKTVHENRIFNQSCLNFGEVISPDKVDGIIFSPPYANCFDYTEIYKLELWFGDFVKNYDDLKVLRGKSLKSHLNYQYDQKDLTSDGTILGDLIQEVSQCELWAKKIPLMLRGYFDDMFNVIDNCYKSLKQNGFCAIVIGNSSYGGIVIPTDLILAEYAEAIGFEVSKIEVDRYIITSSQQYEKTKQYGKYLRESVVCLKKIK